MKQLDGKTIAFAGRLASMTQREAEELVRARGGDVVPSPGSRTDFLVVGKAEWPLRGDGHVSRKLEKARALREKGSAIGILGEEEFLERLELVAEQEHIRRLYTISQLSRILGVPDDRIRRWLRTGVIRPTRTVHRLAYFDFRQVASAKTLWKLVQAGVPLERIRRSLSQLGEWLPEVEDPLAQLALIDHDRRILVRLDGDRIADTRGQLYFPFPEFTTSCSEAPRARTSNPPIAIPPAERSPGEHFEEGLRLEQEGDLEAAVDAYRKALEAAEPEPEACFNLGNVLYALGRREESAAPYLQAVELDCRYVEAWNNLGNVLAELGELEQAIRAYRKALEVEPLYADAHYNLAEAWNQIDRIDQARHHWRSYLKQDPKSSWADHVRERLRRTRPASGR